MKSIKCFNCKQKGTYSTQISRRVDLEESAAETTKLCNEQDLTTDEAKKPYSWFLNVTAGDDGTANTRGPTYKVNLQS